MPARRPSPVARQALDLAKTLQLELDRQRGLVRLAIRLAFGLPPAALLACFGIHAVI